MKKMLATILALAACSSTASDLVIKELRLRGAAGAEDEYVQVFNRAASTVTIAASDASAGWAIVSETLGLLVTIPNGTVIPSGGSFLAANSNSYSLSNYGGAGLASPDTAWAQDVPDGDGIGLFTSATTFNGSTVSDAVGFTGSSSLYREGSGLPSVISANGEWTFARKTPYSGGATQDTDDNAANFRLISTNAGIYSGVQSALGGPGPRNLSSPKSTALTHDLADTGVGANAAPNRIQVGNYHYFRRKVTNNTPTTITKMRMRVTDLSTLHGDGYNPGVQADWRGISTSDIVIALSNATTPTAKGLTLEAPSIAYSSTGKGAGYNASFIVDLGGSLAPGATVFVNVGFRNVKGGSFYFSLLPTEILN